MSFWTLKKEVGLIAGPRTRLLGPGMGIGMGRRLTGGRLGAVQGKAVVFISC